MKLGSFFALAGCALSNPIENARGHHHGGNDGGISNDVDINGLNIAPIVANKQNFINIQTNYEADVDVSVGCNDCAKNAKVPKGYKDSKDSKDSKWAKDAKDSKWAKDAKDSKWAKDAKDSKWAKDAKDSKLAKDSKSSKDSKWAKSGSPSFYETDVVCGESVTLRDHEGKEYDLYARYSQYGYPVYSTDPESNVGEFVLSYDVIQEAWSMSHYYDANGDGKMGWYTVANSGETHKSCPCGDDMPSFYAIDYPGYADAYCGGYNIEINEEPVPMIACDDVVKVKRTGSDDEYYFTFSGSHTAGRPVYFNGNMDEMRVVWWDEYHNKWIVQQYIEHKRQWVTIATHDEDIICPSSNSRPWNVHEDDSEAMVYSVDQTDQAWAMRSYLEKHHFEFLKELEGKRQPGCYEEDDNDEYYDAHDEYYDAHDEYYDAHDEEGSMEAMKKHKMKAMAGIWELMKMGKDKDEWANGDIEKMMRGGFSNDVDMNVANIAPIVSNDQNFINIQTNIETDVDVSVGGCAGDCGNNKKDLSERDMEMLKEIMEQKMMGKEHNKEDGMKEFADLFQQFH